MPCCCTAAGVPLRCCTAVQLRRCTALAAAVARPQLSMLPLLPLSLSRTFMAAQRGWVDGWVGGYGVVEQVCQEGVEGVQH